MNFIIIIGIALVGIGGLIFFVRRSLLRRESVQAKVSTPDGYTEHRISQDFVVVTFTTKSGEEISKEYYYDVKIYNHPSDFQRLHPVVTVKYEPGNPANFIVFEEKKGDYSTLIGVTVMGTAFGAFIAAQQETTDVMVKAKVFLIWFCIAGGVSFLIVKFNAYFSFLNIFTKRDEE